MKKNLLLTSALIPVLASGAGVKEEKRPNILFFIVDDMGWMDIGANGSDFYETPNIDRLADEGVRFERAYAGSSVSSPTRASIMTGQTPARCGITQYIGGAGNPDYIRNLPLEDVCYPEVLKEYGYTNIYLGKWHLNNREGEVTHWPEAQGYDINLGGHWRGGLYIPNKYFSPWDLPNLTNGPKGEYMTERLTKEAENFIDTIGNRPFLMNFSFYNVHAPFAAPERIVAKYKVKAEKLHLSDEERFATETMGGREIRYRRRQDHATYAAQVECVDIAVGKVLDKLKEKGLDKNTVVIFTSDNGGLCTSEGTPTAIYPLRAGKGWLYEGGIRVPTIVKAPGVSKKGFVSKVPVASMDFYPTILDLAGIPLKPEAHVDGSSMVPVLKGSKKDIHSSLFFHYPHRSNQKGRPSSALMMDGYKLIVYFEDGRKELFNIEKDIREEHDLYSKERSRADKMYEVMKDWWKDTGAKFPEGAKF